MSDDYNDKYKKIEASHAPVTLADEDTHFEALAVPSSATDLWEETATGLVAEAGEYDVLLWMAGYALFGNGKGLWGPGRSAEREIQLIVVPRSQRGKMTDNNFVRVGWTPDSRLRGDRFTVTRTESSVTWDFDGLRFTARPPEWTVDGKAGEAEVDLVYEQVGTALWNWGPFEKARESDRAGYDVFTKVNGTVRTGLHDLRITDGYGVREHIITGQSNDPVKNLPAPMWMWWLYTIKDDVQLNFFQPGPLGIGFVKYAGEQIDFGPGKGTVSYQTLETWEDPRTAMNMPVRWSLAMENAGCRVEVEIAAHGRSYSTWTMSNGNRMYCYLLCTTNGTVHLPDGRVITYDDHLTVNSFHRTVQISNETAAGPVFDLA
ncbi:hypothetical protein ACW4TU_04725 [Streptomyces sp. QTS52]